jgi:hypothetical protein
VLGNNSENETRFSEKLMRLKDKVMPLAYRLLDRIDQLTRRMALAQEGNATGLLPCARVPSSSRAASDGAATDHHEITKRRARLVAHPPSSIRRVATDPGGS